MDFRERLKELRKAKGLSQATLAERLGMSKSTIGMYETGDIKPSKDPQKRKRTGAVKPRFSLAYV